jgi:hypothetical protein
VALLADGFDKQQVIAEVRKNFDVEAEVLESVEVENGE